MRATKYTCSWLTYEISENCTYCINPAQGEIRLAFYDRNDTVRVRWVLASSIKAVKSLTLENIVWHMNLFRDYFGEDKQGQEDQIAGCLFSACPKTHKNHLAILKSDN